MVKCRFLEETGISEDGSLKEATHSGAVHLEDPLQSHSPVFLGWSKNLNVNVFTW